MVIYQQQDTKEYIMADLSRMLTQLVNSSTAKGFAGGLAGGLASNMISGKKAKKLGKGALKVGGAAAIGALAFSAYKRYQNNQAGSPATPQLDVQNNPEYMTDNSVQMTPDATHTSDAQFVQATVNPPLLAEIENDQTNDELSLVLIRAMIAASRADGSMDTQESQKIFERIQSLELDQESTNILLDEMNHPVDMDYLVKNAQSQEKAAEIYAASLLAIDVDNAAEKSYLQMLAARLKLPVALTTEITQQINTQNHNLAA